jgi:predicted aminopeptidase
LYLKGDGRFNESYASFVEETGVRAWLSSYSESEELERWQRLEHVRRDFNHLVRDVREELNIVYSSSQSDAVKRQRKSEILEGMARSHQVLVAEKWDGRNYFSAWFEIPLNNARLALFDTYEGGQCAFRNLMHQAGADIRTFHSLAEQQSRLPEAGRSVWLEQTCDDVGPAVKP